jgi:hypothetical protein
MAYALITSTNRVEKYIQQVKPIQCFNCQKFGHFSSSCEHKTPTCVKYGGRHKISACKSELVKCANWNGNHTSNYGGCKVFQKHQKDKIETVKKKSDLSSIGMQYSQVVKTSNSQADLNSLNESIKGLYSGMKELAISISTNVKNQLSDFERCHESKVNTMMNDIVNRQKIIIKNEFEKAKKELKTI